MSRFNLAIATQSWVQPYPTLLWRRAMAAPRVNNRRAAAMAAYDGICRPDVAMAAPMGICSLRGLSHGVITATGDLAFVAVGSGTVGDWTSDV